MKTSLISHIKKCFLLLSFTPLFINGQTALPADALAAGVPESLAKFRKQFVGNITYNIKFDIPSEKQKSIPASETISFNWKQTTHPLVIDFKEQTDHVKTVAVNNKQIPIVFKNEHIIIDAKYLKRGRNEVAIQFIAGDQSLNRNEDYLYTLLVPERARTLFPCFDQPDLKASFQLSLTLPVNWKALSNAPLIDSTLTGNNKTYRYDASDTISTYLFSFAAGKFEKLSRNIGGRAMNFYHRETDTAKIKHSVEKIFQLHGDALTFLEAYTQIPFPFKKFDFIAIPDFQYGGMEHVGAVQYKASTLFLDSTATKDQELDRAGLIAHETAHMWFGDLVTMRWFNDVWMKEVFANFMADKITAVTLPEINYDLKFLLDHFPAAYNIDRTAGANPIRQTLTNLKDAGSLYGNIIYHKAPIVMRQLERLMGKETFRDGLREYLKKFAGSNASWPELIELLDKRTTLDLQAWNKVWVNEPGRPRFSYSLSKQNNAIAQLKITQTAEQGSNRIWPQLFEIALVYPDHTEEITVNMERKDVLVKQLEGKPIPSYMVFNSTGQGYGIFPVDSFALLSMGIQGNAVMRASVYISLYENLLSGNYAPMQLIDAYRKLLFNETEELNLRLITAQLNEVFWHYTKPEKRNSIAARLEHDVWAAMQQETAANKRKILFKIYQSIALSKTAQDSLYAIWKKQLAPPGVKLAEDDYTSLALALAVRDYADTNILHEQLKRVKNIDRQKRLAFLMPALSANAAIRDAFFASLAQEKNREKEAWVTTALQYLHHPLRAATSKNYLKQSLDLLEEIQSTGDIFFPQSWLQATFGLYQTTEVANVVRDFLKQHSNYNPKLKAKILQAADGLFRAERLVER